MAQLQPYCAIEGNDDGLPVVFVHGMGVDHRSLMMLDKAFDGNDSIRRIYLDLPGFGRTPALPEHACGLPEMADWLQTAIDGLVGKAAPFAMVGNSMGGALVREVLAREPRRVAGMALIQAVLPGLRYTVSLPDSAYPAFHWKLPQQLRRPDGSDQGILQ